MAQNITLLGANYSAVPGVQLPTTGGGTALFTDVTPTTATAADVANGKVFFAADGTQTTGTASGGGGGSSYTLLAETEFTVSTTSTSASNVGVVNAAGVFTKDKLVYVRIRDTAGERSGYFYGCDAFFTNPIAANGQASNNSNGVKMIYRYSGGNWSVSFTTGSSGYGVYPYIVSSTNGGQIRIYSRYNSTNSLTINGTYKVEVFLLDWPGSLSPFA